MKSFYWDFFGPRAEGTAQHAHADAVDDAHPWQASEEGPVEELLDLVGGLVDGAADDFESRNLHQQVNDLLRHAIREVFLILLLTQVHERQHCNRFVRDCRDHRRLKTAVLRRPVAKHDACD